MRKVKLYIAISLDGYIAKPDGDVAWLNSMEVPEGEDYGYAAFYASIDSTIMGRKTYDEVMGFDVPFPYKDKTNYVLTRKENIAEAEHVQFVSSDIPSFIHALKKKDGKDIWLIGGGQINSYLLQHNLIDEINIHIMPIVLGKGIPVFEGQQFEKRLKLVRNKIYSTGVLELVYQLKSI